MVIFKISSNDWTLYLIYLTSSVSTTMYFSVFYHLGGVDVFHHDSPAFSVSDHLWVDAIDAHVTFQSVKPSHLWMSSGSGSHHRHAQRASCYVGLFPSHHMPIP